jgi:Staphylococcal nuclease homologue
MEQPFGKAAKAYASELAFEKVVTVEPTDRDQYGRLVDRPSSGRSHSASARTRSRSTPAPAASPPAVAMTSANFTGFRVVHADASD